MPLKPDQLHTFSGLYLTLIHTASLRKLNGTGVLSAFCLSNPLKSMESFTSRGGVPVLSLPMVNPRFSRVWARPMEGWSPIRPAGCISKPIRIIPLRNVPVVSTTLLECTLLPSPGLGAEEEKQSTFSTPAAALIQKNPNVLLCSTITL